MYSAGDFQTGRSCLLRAVALAGAIFTTLLPVKSTAQEIFSHLKIHSQYINYFKKTSPFHGSVLLTAAC